MVNRGRCRSHNFSLFVFHNHQRLEMVRVCSNGSTILFLVCTALLSLEMFPLLVRHFSSNLMGF